MKRYLAAIWECRFFWYSLTKMDVVSRYKGSILGVGWSLLHPIAMTIILCVVFAQFFAMDVTEYAPSLLAGLTFWNFFSGVVISGCDSIRLGEPFLRQYPLPIAIFPLRTVLAAAFHFVLGMVIVFGLQIYFSGLHNPVALLSLIPTMILVLLFAVATASIFGIVNILFPDTQHLAQIGLQLLFYMTPVLYPVELMKTKGLYWMVQYNPLASVLEAVRQPILTGTLPASSLIVSALIGIVVVSGLATALVARYQPRIVFYL